MNNLLVGCRMYVKLQCADLMVKSATLSSPVQMASYFGYSVAVTDLNGDG